MKKLKKVKPFKKTASWVQKRRQHWQDYYKVKKGCSICGYNKNPKALCFDHIDPATKDIRTKNGQIKGMKAGGMFQLTFASIPRRVMVDEWRKCRILCHNCHHEFKYAKYNRH